MHSSLFCIRSTQNNYFFDFDQQNDYGQRDAQAKGRAQCARIARQISLWLVFTERMGLRIDGAMMSLDAAVQNSAWRWRAPASANH
jgi:hypothetical protein